MMIRPSLRRVVPLAMIALLFVQAVLPSDAQACPFCAAVSQTFSEEIASMDAVVIAKLVEPPPAPAADATSTEVPKAKFQVLDVIKGDSLLKDRKTVETIYFGDAKVGTDFLVMGVDPPNIQWSTPLAITPRAKQYVKTIVKLPEQGKERLDYFQQFLEDEDEMLARDAYDEFAKAPYDDVKALKPDMDHDQLIAWIQDENIPASRRRLYLTMLGVCGSSEDLPMLESMLRAEDRKQKAGLDALIACYLTLRGADGVGLVEELFLKNQDAEYADTYAAIMALRFHGTEADIVPRERILKALHHMLERPQLADLVIPDLARWEDWSQMERLVKLFKEADEKSSWVRVPVINYLRACPDPKADEYIEELKKVDPAAVKRANTFFPFGPGAGSKKTSRVDDAMPEDALAEEDAPAAAEPQVAEGDDESESLAPAFAAMRQEAQEGPGEASGEPAPQVVTAGAASAAAVPSAAGVSQTTVTARTAFTSWLWSWGGPASLAIGTLVLLACVATLGLLAFSGARNTKVA